MFSDGHLEHVPFMWNQRLASLPGLTRLDPAIHPTSKDFLRSRWMRGSSPRMTPCQEILTLKVMRALEDAFLFFGGGVPMIDALHQ